MLKLIDIVKDYPIADGVVKAVDGVCLNFRQAEFVAILGPSGCGKTTTMNLIGGLDKYTSGDIVVDGVSTKQYKDRDWDNYRNKKIGFVFQSYNLITHLNVLGNVEIALTINGIDSAERKRLAKTALTSVGLQDQIYKKINQLSGGQMQRVAIARSLVNNPEILLADEPTGALDSVTGEQIMDIMREISKTRLCIMVTHNPELADKYATRIIRMKDGKVIDDSNPYNIESDTKQQDTAIKDTTIYDADITNTPAITNTQAIQDDDIKVDGMFNIDNISVGNVSSEQELKELDANNTNVIKQPLNKSKTLKNSKKSQMSFMTATKLSYKNLLTKKKRSIMTSIACAIGILGIGLVLALSNGLGLYIDTVTAGQIESTPINITTGRYKSEKQPRLGDKFDIDINDNFKPNQIAPITQEIVDFVKSEIDSEWVNDIIYSTGVKIGFYGKRSEEASWSYIKPQGVGGGNDFNIEDIFTTSNIVVKMPNNKLVAKQYDIVYGKELPTKPNELAFVLNKDGKIDSSVLVGLGIIDEKESGIIDKLTYEDILKWEFRIPTNNLVYQYDSIKDSFYQDMQYTSDSLDKLTESVGDNGVIGKVTCILKQKSDVKSAVLGHGINFTQQLVDYMQEVNKSSEIVKWVLNKYDTTGKYYEPTGQFGAIDIESIIKLINNGLNYIVVNNTKIDAKWIWYNGLNYTMGSTTIQIPGLRSLGGVEIPDIIQIYVTGLSTKNIILDKIEQFNSTRDNISKIYFTDLIKIVGDMMNDLLKIVSIVLIGFIAVSLVVSSVMISIITSISVLERTKEIGILRAIGARKKDVTRLFNAENVILGLLAGVIGVVCTFIFSAIISLVIGKFVPELSIGVAKVVWWIVPLLFGVSTVVSLGAGFLPAQAAAKKDPVVALRTE